MRPHLLSSLPVFCGCNLWSTVPWHRAEMVIIWRPCSELNENRSWTKLKVSKVIYEEESGQWKAKMHITWHHKYVHLVHKDFDEKHRWFTLDRKSALKGHCSGWNNVFSWLWPRVVLSLLYYLDTGRNHRQK